MKKLLLIVLVMVFVLGTLSITTNAATTTYELSHLQITWMELLQMMIGMKLQVHLLDFLEVATHSNLTKLMFLKQVLMKLTFIIFVAKLEIYLSVLMERLVIN